jgi:flagellar motor switch protein FliM
VSNILSQDEVDALLKGVNEGAVATDAPAGGARSGVQTLDLTSQERNLRGRVPGLELMVDRFTKALRTSLGTFFGTVPNVALSAMELRKLDGFMQRVQPPTSMQLFRMPPLRGQGMFVASPGLVSTLLQISFGGRLQRRVAIEGREISTIELKVIERLAGRVLHDFSEAWRPVAAIDFAFQRSESNPRFAVIAAAQDLSFVIAVTIELEGVDGASVSLCIPNAALDPIRAQLQVSLGAETEAPRESWGDRWREVIGEAEIDLRAELGTTRMPLSAVLSLKVGDVVPLGTGRDGPVLMRIEGRPRFLGAPGISSGRHAVRVTGRL